MRGNTALLLILILALAAHADDPAASVLTPGIRPPLAPSAGEDKPNWVERPIVINLDRNGRLTMAGGDVTMRDVGVVLIWHRDHFDKVERKRLKAAGKQTPKRAHSTMRVLLRVDGDAPWGHVAWLIRLCQAKRLDRIEFAVLRSKPAKDDAKPRLDGVLRCWSPPAAIKKPPFFLPISLSATDLRPEKYGLPTATVTIQRAHGARTFLGRVEVKDRAALDQQLAKLLTWGAVKGRRLTAGLKPQGNVPFFKVAEAVELLRKRGFSTVSFNNLRDAPEKITKLPYLPFPKP